jgi:cleavage and polyadenylation specificity factor subunit 3
MQNEPRDFEALVSKKRIVRRMTVHYISFSAHVDFAGNSMFIDQCKPTHLILCHGSRDNMFRLRDALKNQYKEKQQDVQIYTPSNVRDKIKIQLSGTRIAKVGPLVCTTRSFRPLLTIRRLGYWVFS